MWGKFVCDDRKVGYAPIPPMKGYARAAVAESYQTGDSFRGESDPLTPEYLKHHPLPDQENMNWLLLTIWFGLRPLEVDNLKNQSTWRVERDRGVDVLWVYQSKLTSVERSKRWKPIPCILKEQKALLPIIKEGLFRKPLIKVLRNYFDNPKITLYGGRKGFIDLMLDRGQRLEDISSWLGHQSIEMTWKKYRNRRRVSWNKVG